MIQLLASRDVPFNALMVCRHSAVRASLTAATTLVAGTGLILAGYARESVLMYYTGALCLASLLIFRRFLLARFLPSNWLVRLNEHGVYIKFRSYLNHRLPATDTIVAFIPFEVINEARVITERKETSYRDSDDPWITRSEVETLTWMEFRLRTGTGHLALALRDELAKRPVTGALYRDYPVRTPEDGLVHVRWSVVPPSGAFLEALRLHVPIGAPSNTAVDFTGFTGLPAAAQRQRIAALALAGDTVSAVTFARALCDGDLTKAKALVERLTAGEASPDPMPATPQCSDGRRR